MPYFTYQFAVYGDKFKAVKQWRILISSVLFLFGPLWVLCSLQRRRQQHRRCECMRMYVRCRSMLVGVHELVCEYAAKNDSIAIFLLSVTNTYTHADKVEFRCSGSIDVHSQNTISNSFSVCSPYNSECSESNDEDNLLFFTN